LDSIIRLKIQKRGQEMRFKFIVPAVAVACSAGMIQVPLFAQLSSNATVFASNLEAPRGLKFGPDGYLYVAEAGTGGTNSTIGRCTQVIPPIGPYTGDFTSRISRIDSSGNRVTVASGLPSTQDAMGDIMGVADVAFLDGQLYAVTAGGGCSHGNPVPNSIVQVNTKTGVWKPIANVSRFLQVNPAAYPNAADFEPEGTFYSLIAYNGRLYTVEPNHGQVFSVDPAGDIREEIDISLAQGHIVPTSIAEKDGNFFVGNLGLFPITPNASKILTLSTDCPVVVPGLPCDPNGQKLNVVGSRAGFATVVAVEFGPDGLLYALELSPAAGYPSPGTGKVVRLNLKGEIEDVATGLAVPTAMTFGPDGALYVSNFGAAPPGAGQIVRITLP
jgi:glucose/arabinose dehydrogenase